MNQILNRTNRLSPEIKIPPEETTYSHPYEEKKPITQVLCIIQWQI